MSSPSPSPASGPNAPQLSVVIPLYNCLPLTQAMLASLRATLPRDLSHEIIFVDDGSTDGTRAWLQTLGPAIRVILNERNLGYAAANNRGAAAATGENLALLNNDLVLKPRWLEPMLVLQRRLGARAGLIGNGQRDARTGEVDHTGIIINHKGKPEHDHAVPWWRIFPGSWRACPAITGACAVVSRALWGQLGGFNETYVNGCEDVDLCLRAAALGRINAVSLESWVDHHVSASPGRKLRDEENTFKLVTRWREALVPLAARAWCRRYLEVDWSRAREPHGHADARSAFFYAYGLSTKAPAFASAGVNQAIDAEIARWGEICAPPFRQG